MAISFDVSTKKYPNLIATIDECDAHLLESGTRWTAMKGKRTFYVCRSFGGRKNHGFEYMHRVILGLTDPHVHGEHADGNGLNNQRSNLRPATAAENNRNARPHLDGSSIYRGVSWNKSKKMWVVHVCLNYKIHDAGRFRDEVAAARAYDAKAKQLHGDFARLNFPGEQHE